MLRDIAYMMVLSVKEWGKNASDFQKKKPIYRKTKFKISINGESPKYILTTMLMNDLASFTGTIPAGASENLVLVSEIPEEASGSVQSVALLMKNELEDAQLTLN